MDKEKLIKLAEDLYQSAFDANAYYAIMMQYREMSKKYNDEMNLSTAFYQVVYGALQKACFMEIAKLYDKTKDVVSVGLLLKYCRDNLDLFPEYRDIVTIKEEGREYSFQVPYQHHLKPTEEWFYENEVKSQREILKLCHTLKFLRTQFPSSFCPCPCFGCFKIEHNRIAYSPSIVFDGITVKNRFHLRIYLGGLINSIRSKGGIDFINDTFFFCTF